MAMNYLTLQDVLFLNLKLTGSPQAFEYDRLEEATFYQYAPGQSTDLARQGARFLTGFVKMRPFATGNEATAFAGLVVFLEANGKSFRLSDEEAAGWVAALLNVRDLAVEAIRERLVDSHTHIEHGVPAFERISESVVFRYPKALAALSQSPVQSS
jgi:prophage maintenance system killer protein